MRQNTKTIVGAINTATNGVSTISAEFDTLGFNFAKIICLSSSTGTVSTGTNNKLEDGDASTGSFATFAGYIQGTDWTGSATSNATSLAKVIWNVDLRGRKRFLRATFTHATAGVGSVILAELSNPGDGVTDAAGAGSANAIAL
jgi:hypothetical protein